MVHGLSTPQKGGKAQLKTDTACKFFLPRMDNKSLPLMRPQAKDSRVADLILRFIQNFKCIKSSVNNLWGGWILNHVVIMRFERVSYSCTLTYESIRNKKQSGETRTRKSICCWCIRKGISKVRVVLTRLLSRGKEDESSGCLCYTWYAWGRQQKKKDKSQCLWSGVKRLKVVQFFI